MQDVDRSFVSHILQTSFDRKFRFRHRCRCYIRPQSRNRIYWKPESRTWTLQQIFCRGCELDLSAVARPFLPPPPSPSTSRFFDFTSSLSPPEAPFFSPNDNTTNFFRGYRGRKTAKLVSHVGDCKVGGGIRSGRVQRSLAFCNSSVTVYNSRLVAMSCRARSSSVWCLQTRRLPLVDAESKSASSVMRVSAMCPPPPPDCT